MWISHVYFGIPYNTKMKAQVVIDTNVLLTALRSSQGTSFRLLSMLEGDKFQLHISTPLVAEYESVLKRGLLALTSQQIDDVVDFMCAQAIQHKIYYLWRPVLKDPGDDFVLELAVKANARIITWNITDFRRAHTLGVLVQTPKEFLNFLERK
jgi:putative PIN family toxin of toxin-antitoxin system